MKKLVAVAVSCVAAVSLAACGSSSKKASTSKDTSTTAGATASANANVAAAADLLKYCDFSKAAQAFSPASGLSDPSNLKTEIDKLKANANAYVNVAPSEIKADVRVYIDKFLTPLANELARVNGDITKINPSVFTSIGTDGQVQTALKHIGDYYAAHCSK